MDVLRFHVKDSCLGVIAQFALHGDAKKWADEYNDACGNEFACFVVDTNETDKWRGR